MQDNESRPVASCGHSTDIAKGVTPRWRGTLLSKGNIYRTIKWRSLKTKNIVLRYGREHTVSLAAVALLHVAFFLAIAWASSSTKPRPVSKDLQAVLFRTTPSPRTDISFPDVALPVVAPPQVAIEDEQPSRANAVVSSTLVLPPRPDPDHPNEQPVSPDHGAAPVVVLKILVSPEGKVVDAKIVPPLSGNQSADIAALAWVKANWHFIPAMLDTAPIQYWTTVSVRFSDGG